MDKVLRSMAFENEPIDRRQLESEVDRLRRTPADDSSPIEPDRATLRIGARVALLQHSIADGQFDNRALDGDLLRELHRRICADVAPDIAGRWRLQNVQIGRHEPPAYAHVPQRMRDYELDLQTRIAALSPEPRELWLEALAFAEGRLLSIHPFADFNGRTTRVFLDLLTFKLALPDIDPTPDEGEPRARYLHALRSADRNNWAPLTEVWRDRLEKTEAAQ